MNVFHRKATLRTGLLVLAFTWLAAGRASAQCNSFELGDSYVFPNTQIVSGSGTGTVDVTAVNITNPCYDVDFVNRYIDLIFNTGNQHLIAGATFSATIEVKVSYTANGGGSTPGTGTYSLTIDQNRPEAFQRIPFSTAEVEGTNLAQVQILSSTITMDPSLTGMLEFEAVFHTDQRVGSIDNSNPSTSPVQLSNPTVTPGSNRVTFDWSLSTPAPDIIPNYEFQLLRLYNTKTNLNGDSLDMEATVDWSKALSIETKSRQTSLTLSVMEGTGYYLWRVRPIGTYYQRGFGNYQNWGLWPVTQAQGAQVTDIIVSQPYAFYFRQPDMDMNWSYHRSFSNDKAPVYMGESGTYVNGLNQVIQTQTRIASQDEVSVAENLRDYSGRNAWTGLPIPRDGKTEIRYEDGFTRNTSSQIYGPQDFDATGNYLNPGHVQSTVGSNYQYFSDNNTDVRIPDAEGYPYSRTRFLADGTGRLKQIGAVGSTFRIRADNDQDDRTTRFFYSGVADAELVRVFGDEAPLGESVSKTLVQDANRVMTVTYTDKAGQTLATCLSSTGANDFGDPNAPLDGLSSQVDAAFGVADSIKQKQPYGNYGSISSKTLVVTEPSTVNMNYELDIATIQDLCSQYCATCDYQVYLQVKDMDDFTIIQEDSLILPPTICEGVVTPVSLSLSVFLQPGSYQFSKVIKVNNWNQAQNMSNLAYHKQRVGNYYDSLIYQQPLDSLLSYLDHDSVHLDSFYLMLGVDINVPNAFQLFIDSSATITIGCEEFEIPIHTCPTFSCNLETGDMDGFVDYFVDFWEGDSFVTPNALDQLPFLNEQYTEAEFEQMIKNMVWDGYDCEDLWNCWISLTENYTYFTNQNGLSFNGLTQPQGGGYSQSTTNFFNQNPAFGGYTFQYDLVDNFLQCVGYQYTGSTQDDFGTNGGVIFGSATPGFLSHAYAYFEYQWGDNPNCEDLICPGAGDMDDCADQINSSANPDSLWLIFRGCLDNSIIPTGGAVNGVSVMTTTQNQLNEMRENCEDVCENRRQSFRQAAIAEFHRNDMSVEGDPYFLQPDTVLNVPTHTYNYNAPIPNGYTGWEVFAADLDCLVDSLVNLCKDGCQGLAIQYDGSGNVTGIGTQAAFDSLTQSMMWPFELTIADGGSCPDSAALIGPSTAASNSGATQMANLWTQWLNGGGGIYGQGQLPPGTGAITPGGSYQIIAGNYTILINPFTGSFQVYQTGTNSFTIVQNHPMVSALNHYFQDYWNYEIGGYPLPPSCGNGFISLIDNPWVTGMRAAQFIDLDQDYPYVNAITDKPSSFFEDPNFNDGIYGETKVFGVTPGGNSHGQTIVSSIPMLVNRRALLQYLPDTTLLFGSDDTCSTRDNGRTPVASYHGCFTTSNPYRFEYPSPASQGWWESLLPQFTQDANGYLSYVDPLNTSQSCNLNQVRFYTTDSLVWDTNWTAGLDTSSTTPYGSFVYDPTTGYINFISPLGDTLPISYFNFGPPSTCDFPEMCLRWLPPISPSTAQVDSIEILTCEQEVALSLRTEIEALIADVREDAVNAIHASYQSTCADPKNISDRFWLSYTLKYHHYTLYYYDRAGRLIKTVPPEGVDLLNTSSASVLNRQVSPQHRLVTMYNYDSRAAVSAQYHPDGGQTTYWYDSKNQLRFSQNAQQKVDDEYSYTKYDELGRITESGVSNQLLGFQQNYVDDATFPTSGNSEQVWTYYDNQAPGLSNAGYNQQNLNHRVSYTTTHQGHSTYYSYDPHGNVAWVLQEIHELGRFLTSYTYDLYTNNVLAVNYQVGKADQFRHSYSYDADNRLTSVRTSRYGRWWERDARYEYYHHGPLARAEIAEDRIQGLDYTYTLRGWLKGINEPSLSWQDNGRDGLAGTTNANVAPDAYGLAMTYFNGDFDRTGHPLAHSTNTVNARPADANRNLYNGNISTISYQRRDNTDPYSAYQYRYDEIQRLKEARHNEFTTTWTAQPDRWSAYYSYDGNGNLTNLQRFGETAGQAFDEFSYVYPYTGGNLTSNRLQFVDDGIGSGVSAVDIDSQLPGNYTYDAIGNLTRDVSEDISTITWYKNGKVRLIFFSSNRSNLEFEYNAMGHRVKKIEKTKDAMGSVLPEKEWNITYYARDAQGNVMGVYERDLEAGGAIHSYYLVENPIYGSSRLGSRKERTRIYFENVGTPGFLQPTLGSTPMAFQRTLNQKQYELTDHLGNVRVVTSDRRTNGSVTSNALSFDGTNDYVPLDLFFDNTTPIPELTVEAWIKTSFNDPGGNYNDKWAILDFDRSDYFNVYIHPDGRVGFSTRGVSGGINDMFSIDTVNDGNWHHIAAVYDGTDKYIYIDGVLNHTVTPNHSGFDIGWTSTRYGFIGSGSEATTFNGPRNNFYFEGEIDEVRLWTVVRSQSNLSNYKDVPLTGSETGLLAYWRMDEGSGQILTDATGNGHTGYLGSDITLADIRDPAWTERANGLLQAEVLAAMDYYPFGMQMPGRLLNTPEYRYGFQGQEKDDEVSGSGNSYTAEYWQYDPRLGKRWNKDPITYPWHSSYAVFNNNPIIYIDPNGLFGTRKEARRYKRENKEKGRIRKNEDGVFSIDNSKAGTSIFMDEEFGLTTAALVEDYRRAPWNSQGQENMMVEDRGGIQITSKDGIIGSQNDAFKTKERDVQITDDIIPGATAGGSPKPSENGLPEIAWNIAKLFDQLASYFSSDDEGDDQEDNKDKPVIEKTTEEQIKEGLLEDDLENKPDTSIWKWRGASEKIDGRWIQPRYGDKIVTFPDGSKTIVK